MLDLFSFYSSRTAKGAAGGTGTTFVTDATGRKLRALCCASSVYLHPMRGSPWDVWNNPSCDNASSCIGRLVFQAGFVCLLYLLPKHFSRSSVVSVWFEGWNELTKSLRDWLQATQDYTCVSLNFERADREKIKSMKDKKLLRYIFLYYNRLIYRLTNPENGPTENLS